MKYGRVAGVELPVSRLIMGVDNQKAAPHAFAMFDDYVERAATSSTAPTSTAAAPARRRSATGSRPAASARTVILDKGAHTPNCNPEALSRQFRESLERLQMDYVDIYMLHRDNLECDRRVRGGPERAQEGPAG